MVSGAILVVEDDPILLSDIHAVLEEGGLTVVGMDNADDALAFIFEQPSAVMAILSYIQMPGHFSGLHLAETVARHWPHIRIILCSGWVLPADPLPANVLFFSKPWGPPDILALMQNIASQTPGGLG